MLLISKFLQETEGTTAVEYAVMLALILIVMIGAITSTGGEAGGMWGGVSSNIDAALN